jgi:hypothetical protein
MQEKINEIAEQLRSDMVKGEENYCIGVVSYLPSSPNSKNTQFVYKNLNDFKERVLDHCSTIDSTFSIDFEIHEYA